LVVFSETTRLVKIKLGKFLSLMRDFTFTVDVHIAFINRENNAVS
jgi:hypothetical protein